jgi:ABC-type lipoprotein release transport system permease subunit
LTFVSSQFLASQLYGANPHDPAVILIAVMALVLSVVVASLIPAVRASLVTPVNALRTES